MNSRGVDESVAEPVSVAFRHHVVLSVIHPSFLNWTFINCLSSRCGLRVRRTDTTTKRAGARSPQGHHAQLVRPRFGVSSYGQVELDLSRTIHRDRAWGETCGWFEQEYFRSIPQEVFSRHGYANRCTRLGLAWVGRDLGRFRRSE